MAAAGTAMTADHLRSLSRLTFNVFLAFDADQAGVNATERAIPIAQSVGIDLKVISMPEGYKDPDELIQANPGLWSEQIHHATDAITWTLQRYEQQYDKTTAEGKRQLSTKALSVIKGLKDPVEQEHHLKVLAQNLEVSEQSLSSKLQRTHTKELVKKQSKAAVATPDKTAYEDDFLALNAAFVDVRDSLSLLSGCTLATKEREAVKVVLQKLPAHIRLDAQQANRLNELADYAKILLLTAEEKYASWTPADIMAETMALARRIISKSKSKSKSELTAAIAEAEARGDYEQAAALLDTYQQLLKKG